MTAFLVVIPGISVPYATFAVNEAAALDDAANHYDVELPPGTVVSAMGNGP